MNTSHTTVVRTTRTASLMTLALLLGACAAPEAPQSSGGTTASPAAPSPGTTEQSSSRECNAEPVQYAVGQHYTPELGEKVRELSGATVMRTLQPGQVVTMEYRFDRVSLHLDDQGIVTMVSCG
jgi:hypothetical protein